MITATIRMRMNGFSPLGIACKTTFAGGVIWYLSTPADQLPYRSIIPGATTLHYKGEASLHTHYNGRMPFSGEQHQVLLKVARAAIRGTLSGSKPPAPDAQQQSDAIRQSAGCFVSLHDLESHRLRGCVGRLESRAPLIVTVHESAINVLSDPRFTHDPVKADQLAGLDLELTVLSPMTPAVDCLGFDPARHGIFLTIGGRGGCFLPQVARDTGWGREQLLDRLCTEKLSIPAQSWKQPAARLHTFTAEIIGPEPFETPLVEPQY